MFLRDYDSHMMNSLTGPSMIMLIQRICIALSGEENPSPVAILAIVRAAKLVLNWNAKKQRMLKKVPFPSAIAKVMD